MQCGIACICRADATMAACPVLLCKLCNLPILGGKYAHIRWTIGPILEETPRILVSPPLLKYHA